MVHKSSPTLSVAQRPSPSLNWNNPRRAVPNSLASVHSDSARQCLGDVA
jgi:hypothetical protein